MTMPWQELMLFGGWAKAQIPPPIELGVEKSSDMLSLSISPNSADPQISITAYATSEHQVNGEYREVVLPATWLRSAFRERWSYTRQMRADPRLLKVITLFAGRIRKPCLQPPSQENQLPQAYRENVPQVVREHVPLLDLSQTQIGKQVLSNPVVQEAIRLFQAIITDIELVPKVSPPAQQVGMPLATIAPPPRSAELLQPTAIREDTQNETHLMLKGFIDELQGQISDLETQVRRREYEKEALRRQVKRLGGANTKPWA